MACSSSCSNITQLMLFFSASNSATRSFNLRIILPGVLVLICFLSFQFCHPLLQLTDLILPGFLVLICFLGLQFSHPLLQPADFISTLLSLDALSFSTLFKSFLATTYGVPPSAFHPSVHLTTKISFRRNIPCSLPLQSPPPLKLPETCLWKIDIDSPMLAGLYILPLPHPSQEQRFQDKRHDMIYILSR